MTRPTDTSERALEQLICTALTGAPCEPGAASDAAREPETGYGGAGWVCGRPEDYDRDHCVDLIQLRAFLRATQPELVEALGLEEEGPGLRRFLARLQGEISKRGTVDVLRHGIRHGPHRVALYHARPSPGNAQAAELFAANRFSVTRQLRYSRDETMRALDVALFVNGLPVATMELKNRLTKQTVEDAVWQYKVDRNPRERLFELGRCLVHFAVDDQEVRFCTHLAGKASWFLPFNKGWNGGAGNPPNPHGIKTDYLWKEVLARESLADIIENYALLVVEKDARSGRKRRVQIWPRYHQLDVVRRLLADASEKGTGRRYLIQHSAGSGKSNSIAWLAHQLIGLQREGKPVFDSIIVVTDRRVLDRQIRDTIRQFAQVRATVGHAERSGDLRRFITEGKKIIITTVQKFPFILNEIGAEHHGRNFAIIIDEAHSSQGGRTTARMHQALAGVEEADEEETLEDRINRLVESRKLLTNASYFAFTATPKNKTLELFGELEPLPDGTVRRRPFHAYTMKQAIEECFILDVLRHYTPVKSFYRLIKKVEDDPEFDVKKAQKKLRRFVEGHEHPIRVKTEIMIDHFHTQVIANGKIGGQARAMVVTGSIERAIQYFHAFNAYLAERKSPWKAIVAFSGQHEHAGKMVTEESLNGFSSSQIPEKIVEDPYRFLICADKFQTGYDEPLMHTMYVDKPLSGVKAVQTLSRLNRAHPQKHDVFVLDFQNDAETIRKAFEPYYRATILAEETDPNRLHDLAAELDASEVYSRDEVDELVRLYLEGADRERLDPVLDGCVAVYCEELDEDGQVAFKGGAKAFLRAYGFLSQVLPWSNPWWEKLSIFLNFLVPKLPAPREEDLSRGILEAIDMSSYRAEMQKRMHVRLADADAEIDPVPTSGGGSRPEPELERLSNIVRQFNELHGNIQWNDKDAVFRMIAEEIPARVSKDEAYRQAQRHSDPQNARIEHDRALQRVMTTMVRDNGELFKQFMDNEDFRNWMLRTVFDLTYRKHHVEGAV